MSYKLWYFLDKHVSRKYKISVWLWEKRLNSLGKEQGLRWIDIFTTKEMLEYIQESGW